VTGLSRICRRCESKFDPQSSPPCRCRCAQCNKRLDQSPTKPQTYCSDNCRKAAHRKREASKNTAAVTQSLTNEWYTPTEYIEAARRVLGGFDLDPASCEEANQTVGASSYYSESDSGLDHGVWKGRVWLNPPYGRLAGAFVVRCAEQYQTGNVTAAVILVNAHCTDTTWFQPLWDGALCFTRGRLNFAAGTAARSGSTHGSVFAYLGPDSAAFAREFAQFGAIVRRWPDGEPTS
jgi:phage N-6-adenine-methyltransferase